MTLSGVGRPALWPTVVACLLLLGMVSAILFSSPRPPVLGDYAEWTYHGVLLRDSLQGHADAGYLLKRYPVPNSMTTVGLGLLMLGLPWLAAAKLWLLIMVALGAVAVAALARAARSSSLLAVILLAPAMLLGIPFWAGFTNFLLGASMAMILCALLLSEISSRWLYGCLFLLVFFCHMIPFAFAMLAFALFVADRRRWSMLWQTAPSFVASLWYLIAKHLNGDLDSQAGMMSSVPFGAPLFAFYKINSYLKSWGFINPALGPDDSILLRIVHERVFLVLFLLNALLAACSLILLVRAGWAALRRERTHRFFWLAVSIFFAVSLILPGAMAGISDPGGRMMQVAIWSGLAVALKRQRPDAPGDLAHDPHRRWLRPVAGALAVAASALLGVNAYMLQSVALSVPSVGQVQSALPERLRIFGHIYFADRQPDYASVERGAMHQEIYPTALFIKR